MGSLITQAGLSDIATASFLHQQCNWTQIAVGDGGGSEYVPTANQEQLRNERWRGAIENYTATNETQGIFQAHIPADVGGFMVREIGILNEEDDLVAIATIEETPKTALTGESDHYNDMLINFHIAVDHADIIRVQINPNITVATTEFVLDTINDEFNKRTLYECDEEDIQEAMGISWSGSGGGDDDPDYEVATTEEVINAFKQGLSS